jgi:DNA-binding beta-propeller fold protein YncE
VTTAEDRLKAALAATARAVREDTLRPLVVPGLMPRRRWRLIAPLAVAAAVVLTLGVDIGIETMTGTPTATTGTVSVGEYPAAVAFDPANRTIYVAAGEQTGTLAMVNAATCNASSTQGCAQVGYASTGGEDPTAVAIDDQTQTIYVLNDGSHTVAVISAAGCNAVTTSGCSTKALVSLPGLPSSLALNPRTDTIYVAYYSGKVSVINGGACNASDARGCHRATATMRIGTTAGPYAITVAPVTNTLYASTGSDLAIIDGRTCNGTDVRGCAKVLAMVPVDGWTSTIAVDGPAGTVYVASPRSGAVTVIGQMSCSALDAAGCAARLLTARAGPGARQLAADPGAQTVYVTNPISNTVSMVSTATCSATSSSGCTELPAAFPVGAGPDGIAVDAAAHTIYVANAGADTLSVINGATCNASDSRGCPTKSPAGTPRLSGMRDVCDPEIVNYESGLPAALFSSESLRVAAGSVGGRTWSLWARKGIADPDGIEEGGLVLGGRWYALCDGSLPAGPDGNMELIDAGARGVVYGFVQHPSRVTMRLASSGRLLPPPSAILLHGTTFFIGQLPRSACSYPMLTLNVGQGSAWTGISQLTFGACVTDRLVLSSGYSSWGAGPSS